ncbi:uncharacterized protein LOC128333554 isoform X2 [Hemicordylus capensis]|uniref:uncharacterized protein LOC128333554 isoform X2 n=1 Tax=Hemicordylus capensis TaxID=884348 RepID=UPI0023035C27|nr:uncharacterized protein LOC128333554 isoform X2 [Hemicordylus capensis]
MGLREIPACRLGEAAAPVCADNTERGWTKGLTREGRRRGVIPAAGGAEAKVIAAPQKKGGLMRFGALSPTDTHPAMKPPRLARKRRVAWRVCAGRQPALLPQAPPRTSSRDRPPPPPPPGSRSWQGPPWVCAAAAEEESERPAEEEQKAIPPPRTSCWLLLLLSRVTFPLVSSRFALQPARDGCRASKFRL